MDQHDFADGALRARVAAHGAELCSLTQNGVEVMWDAAPVWPRHSPVLFPIVGRLAQDHLHHDGATYHMTQHGFARDCDFAWLDRDATGCRLVLTDSAAMRAAFPFAFRLELAYRIAAGALLIDYRLENPGLVTLPASLGTHPAFRWPLIPGVPKNDHRIVFAQAEPEPIRRLAAGLMLPDAVPTPIHGTVLPLNEALFSQDALILDRPHSQSARLDVPDGRGVTVAWEGFRQLGIWSKPADFICIEPWFGMASPTGFDGAFADKPGLALIPPAQSMTFRLTITPDLEP